MARYFSHTIILPDETRLTDFIVDVEGSSVAYYPFVGEIHSTIYVEHPILLSHRPDLGGKTVSLDQLSWAMGDAAATTVHAYSLTPCPTCMGDRYVLAKL